MKVERAMPRVRRVKATRMIAGSIQVKRWNETRDKGTKVLSNKPHVKRRSSMGDLSSGSKFSQSAADI